MNLHEEIKKIEDDFEKEIGMSIEDIDTAYERLKEEKIFKGVKL